MAGSPWALLPSALLRPCVLSCALGLGLLLAGGSATAQDDDAEEDWDEGDDSEGTAEEGEGGAAEDTAAPADEAEAASASEGSGDELDEEEFDETSEAEGDEPAAAEDEASVARRIAEIMDIYSTKEKRRDPLEHIVADGGRAEIWFLHGLGGDTAAVQKARCDAFRWMFFGRLTRSKGVDEVFRVLPAVQEVRLSLFSIETQIQPDGRRGYRQFRKADPKMEITVSRTTVQGLDLPRLRERLQGPNCAKEGERVADKVWIASPEVKK